MNLEEEVLAKLFLEIFEKYLPKNKIKKPPTLQDIWMRIKPRGDGIPIEFDPVKFEDVSWKLTGDEKTNTDLIEKLKGQIGRK